MGEALGRGASGGAAAKFYAAGMWIFRFALETNQMGRVGRGEWRPRPQCEDDAGCGRSRRVPVERGVGHCADFVSSFRRV